jgi:hypothetical protein
MKLFCFANIQIDVFIEDRIVAKSFQCYSKLFFDIDDYKLNLLNSCMNSIRLIIFHYSFRILLRIKKVI